MRLLTPAPAHHPGSSDEDSLSLSRSLSLSLGSRFRAFLLVVASTKSLLPEPARARMGGRPDLPLRFRVFGLACWLSSFGSQMRQVLSPLSRSREGFAVQGGGCRTREDIAKLMSLNLRAEGATCFWQASVSGVRSLSES